MSCRTLFITFSIAFAIALLVTLHSYFRSVSVTFCDATVCTDEGALSLQIPLVRLAKGQPFRTSVTVYRRGEHVWEHPSGSQKSTLQGWMELSDSEWFKGASFGKFGYWQGDWQNDSRPGAFIVVFIPIWLLVLAAWLLFALVRHYRVTWSMRWILLVTLIAGIGLRLLTLREPA